MKSAAASVGCTLLLVNFLLAPLLTYRPATWNAEQELVICTSEGRVTLSPSGLPSIPKPAHDDHFCGFCLKLSSPDGGLIAAIAGPLPIPVRIGAADNSAVTNSLTSSLLQLGGYARRPPVRHF